MRAATAVVLGGMVASAAAQCSDISTPSSVTAGAIFELELKNNLTRCDLTQDTDPTNPDVAQGIPPYNTYRVYLAANPNGKDGLIPACLLLNDTSLTHSISNLSIPPDLGPNGNFYSIAVMPFYNDPSGNQSRYGATGFGPSFSLLGSSVSAWSTYVITGLKLWEANNLPCSAFGCASQCATANYFQDGSMQENVDQMSNCIRKCPGVTSQSPNLGWNGDGCAQGDQTCCFAYGNCGDSVDAALITTSLATTTPPPTAMPTAHNAAASKTGGIAAILGVAGVIAAIA